MAVLSLSFSFSLYHTELVCSVVRFLSVVLAQKSPKNQPHHLLTWPVCFYYTFYYFQNQNLLFLRSRIWLSFVWVLICGEHLKMCFLRYLWGSPRLYIRQKKISILLHLVFGTNSPPGAILNVTRHISCSKNVMMLIGGIWDFACTYMCSV